MGQNKMNTVTKLLSYLGLGLLVVSLVACSGQTKQTSPEQAASSSTTSTSKYSSTSSTELASSTSSSTATSTQSTGDQSAQTQTSQAAVPPQPVLHPNYQAILTTYSKWIRVLRNGGTFDDPTVEEGYLKNIDPHVSFYYALYDIDGNGQLELLLATGSDQKFIFSIWGNESYPTRLLSKENVRVYVDIFENGLMSSFFLDGYRPESSGTIYRISMDSLQAYAVGSFTLNPHTGQLISDGPEILPDRSTAIQAYLDWQLLE